jgi:cytochrome P450
MKLQVEIHAVCDDGKELTIAAMKDLFYLNGIVSEGLRLYNPLPGGVHATIYPAGVEVSGVFIPGNCQVNVSHFIIMTDERYFPRGEEFIPERWTNEKPELVVDRRAFIP